MPNVPSVGLPGITGLPAVVGGDNSVVTPSQLNTQTQQSQLQQTQQQQQQQQPSILSSQILGSTPLSQIGCPPLPLDQYSSKTNQ